MTDWLERELRPFLANRDPGPAPARLHRAVWEATDTIGRPSSIVIRVRRLASTAAALVAVAIVAAVLVVVSPGRVVPGGSGSATPVPTGSAVITVIHPGDGVTTTQGNEGPVVIVLAIGTLLGWLTIRARSRRWRAVPVGLAVLLVGAILALANVDAIAFRDGAMAVQPVSTLPPNTDLYPDSHAQVMAVRPNELFPVVVTVTNVSPLPIVLEGLVAPRDDAAYPAPRFVAIGLVGASGAIDLDRPAAFHPTTIAAGGQLDVYLLASAGPCSSLDDSFARYLLQGVDLVYEFEFLGVRKTGSVALPTDIAVPAQDANNGCAG